MQASVARTMLQLWLSDSRYDFTAHSMQDMEQTEKQRYARDCELLLSNNHLFLPCPCRSSPFKYLSNADSWP